MLHQGSIRIDLQPDQLGHSHSAELHDDRRVIGGSLLGPRTAIDLAALQTICQLWRQQEMVDTNAAVVLERLPEIIPESELSGLVRMERPKRVGIAELEQSAISCPRLRLEERVADPRCRLVTIDVF